MGILNDREITRLSVEGFALPGDSPGDRFYGEIRKMIEPFAENKKRPGKISYGVSSYGYDFRIGNKFQLFTPSTHRYVDNMVVVDPKEFDTRIADEVEIEDGEAILLPPNSFTLGVAVERFCIPRDILTLCLGKSTYARCGIVVNVTPFEPEWEGYPTVELTNTGPRAVKVYAGEGIAQLIFLQAGIDWKELRRVIDLATNSYGSATDVLDQARFVCDTSYADKGGRYQGQGKEIVHSRVD